MNGPNGHRPRTVSDGVKDTYYGLPVVKAPHWRWLVILYFFFGGLAGASFTIGTLANLFARDRAIERASRYLTVAALLPCPPLLILDLGRPERFLNMLRVLKLKSAMSLGSWALTGLGVVAMAGGGLQAASDLQSRDVAPRLRRSIGIAGLPFSIILSGYTGVLLSATNIPLWWRAFPLLSPTFVCSAYSTTLAALSIILHLGGHEQKETAHTIARAETICLATEITGLTLILLKLGALGEPLRRGPLGRVFWPVTYVGGLVVPLALLLSGPARGRETTAGRRWLAAGLTLTGGLSLRALMIFAGRESARRPRDYFTLTSGIRSEGP